MKERRLLIIAGALTGAVLAESVLLVVIDQIFPPVSLLKVATATVGGAITGTAIYMVIRPQALDK